MGMLESYQEQAECYTYSRTFGEDVCICFNLAALHSHTFDVCVLL
jgi:hypothetical protein